MFSIIVLYRLFCPLPVCRRQLSVCLWDLLSTFRMFVGPSINFPSSRKTFRQLLSTFRASAGPPANFLYGRGTVYQLSVRPWDLPSSAVNILCRQNLPEIFHASTRPSVNFRQHSVHLSTFNINFPLTFSVSAEIFVNFRQLSVRLRDLPSTSVNSLCILGTFCQYFVHPWDLP